MWLARVFFFPPGFKLRLSGLLSVYVAVLLIPSVTSYLTLLSFCMTWTVSQYVIFFFFEVLVVGFEVN